jgi:hypothetical protein
LALMSEPGVYGAGIIGIVSYNVTIVINPPLRTTCLAAVIYGNLAFTRCEMDERTGSVSETKRPPPGRKEVEVLTVSWPRCTKSDDFFNLRSLAPFASACAVSIKAREARRIRAGRTRRRPSPSDPFSRGESSNYDGAWTCGEKLYW